MKTIKVLVLTLMLGMTGYAYASGNVQSTTQEPDKMSKATAVCMMDGGGCCKEKADCCKEGADCCKGGDCCEAGMSCCASGAECCGAGEKACMVKTEAGASGMACKAMDAARGTADSKGDSNVAAKSAAKPDKADGCCGSSCKMTASAKK
jgi:hypothetical protein